MLNNARWFILLILGTLLVACHNGAQSQGLSKDINWQSLEFKCIHQADIWPKLDKDADSLFQTARTLQRKRIDADNEIITLYQQAADKNHFKAIANLSSIYRDGDGTKLDIKKAIELTEQLIEMNIGVGYYQMGNFLERGLGVKQDKAAALTYYRKSADLGNPQGQYLIGDKLLGIFSASEDRNKGLPIAIKMLECSLDQGYSKAGLALGFHRAGVSYEDKAPGIAYFQKAAALGDSLALYNLYSIFANGEDGFEKDPTRATCYKRLEEEADADKTKVFPNIDKICPLPPKPMPNAK